MSIPKIILVLAIVFTLVFIAFKVTYKKPIVYPQCGNRDHQMFENADTTPSEGRSLFIAKCSACHNASSKRSTGPGLRDVLSRIPSREWAYAFIRNADSVIKSGDAYAVKIWNESEKAPHTLFPTLTKREINLILEYCDPGPAERNIHKPGTAVD